jgi:hypothetical protein
MELDQHFVLSVVHLLFVVPLFLVIGVMRGNTPHWLFQSVFLIGAVLLVYHGFKLVVRLHARSNYAWVNAIHLLWIAPLLLYIGYYKKDTPRSAYEMLLLLGFAAGGYHLYSLVKMLQVYPEPEMKK